MSFEVGKAYKTVGGWKAKIIYKISNEEEPHNIYSVVAIHYIEEFKHTNGNLATQIRIHDLDGRILSKDWVFTTIPGPHRIQCNGDLTTEEWKD